jgi:phosphoadenosine phosphosulfate reductase
MTAEEVVEQAVERHHPRLALLCSFQKTSSVLVDMVLRVAPDARIVTLDTGVLFPETLETWRAFEDHYDTRIEVVDAHGPWSPTRCCADRKVAALDRALGGMDGWISGIRRHDASDARADAEHVEWDGKRGIWKYNPLAEWTDKDVWARIFDRDLPYHPLHDQGYDSIGCMPCTAPGNGRDGRWAGTDRTECGLHA